MSQETSTIELTSRHQLVDLNKKLVNFKLDFQVVSHEDKEFDAVVLDQNQINDNENFDNIEMKNSPGKISGTIIADNNKYKNYFIILKSKEPQKVDVITTIEEIPPKEIVEEEVIPKTLPVDEEILTDIEKEQPFYRTPGCWVLLVLGILLFLFYFRDYLFKKKQTPVIPNTTTTTTTNFPTYTETMDNMVGN